MSLNYSHHFSDTGPWCYNSQGTAPRWEYCDVTQCTQTGSGELYQRNNFIEHRLKIRKHSEIRELHCDVLSH